MRGACAPIAKKSQKWMLGLHYVLVIVSQARLKMVSIRLNITFNFFFFFYKSRLRYLYVQTINCRQYVFFLLCLQCVFYMLHMFKLTKTFAVCTCLSHLILRFNVSWHTEFRLKAEKLLCINAAGWDYKLYYTSHFTVYWRGICESIFTHTRVLNC